MHSHLTHAIVNRETGYSFMPATSGLHGLFLMRNLDIDREVYCVKRLQYDPQPEKRLKGYGITKPGYLLIKYLADNPCAKMTEIVRHIMMEIKGELIYQDVYKWSRNGKAEVIRKQVYYGHFAYLFNPHHSNMTTYGKRTANRRWMHRFKGPDGVYRYHLTALGLDAANKIWQRHHYKWAKVA